MSKKSTIVCGIMKSMEIPITQSKYWQVLQDELGEKSYLTDRPEFHYLAILKNTPVGNYLYLPYGPNYAEKSGFKTALKELVDLAKETNSFFIRIEPRDPNFNPKNAGYKIKKSKDLNPKETWVLDLEGTDEDLKAKLPSRLLRYYKSANNKGITIKTSHNPDDIKYLIKLQKALAKEKGINTFSDDYLKTELAQPFSTLYYVEYENPETKHTSIVAAGMVFDDGSTRYNLQGAQSDEGRSLHATGIMTIQLILDAKEKGLKYFDFWGIAPEGAPKNHPWAGFTNFKKTFAGREVDFAGTYDVILSPAKYRAYSVLRKANKLLKR